jgi:hypothetical protein
MSKNQRITIAHINRVSNDAGVDTIPGKAVTDIERKFNNAAVNNTKE